MRLRSRVFFACIALGAIGGTAFAGTVTVAAADNIYGAGFATAPDGSMPVQITLAPGDQYVTFSITGGTNPCGSTWCVTMNAGYNYNDADGIGSASNMSDNAYNSLSGISGDNAGFLVGVFENGTPSGTAPPSLDFTSGGLGTAFTSLSPLIDQTFFIGDGLTGDNSGSVQQFYVPAGATTLYLGFADASGYHGDPNNGYDDNVGSFQVEYTEVGSVPEPGSVGLIALGAAAMALLRRRAGSR
jgi:hypothetical protein